jgi:hypothetical protein
MMDCYLFALAVQFVVLSDVDVSLCCTMYSVHAKILAPECPFEVNNAFDVKSFAEGLRGEQLVRHQLKHRIERLEMNRSCDCNKEDVSGCRASTMMGTAS